MSFVNRNYSMYVFSLNFFKFYVRFVVVKNKILYRRSCLITIQKNARMLLAKKKYKHRYQGIIKINSLKVFNSIIKLKTCVSVDIRVCISGI